MISPTHEAELASMCWGYFSNANPLLFVLLTLQIIRLSCTWHNLWNLLTINFKNKYFHNSVDWSGLYLQLYIPFSFIYSFQIIIKYICENLPLMPHVEEPTKFVPHLPWKALKSPSIHFGGDTVLALDQFGGMCLKIPKEVRSKTCYISSLAKGIVWLNSSVGWGII